MASTPPSLCPSFCPSNCEFTHHELLLALIDCCDLEPGSEREDSFRNLKSIITKYEQTNKWSKDSIIPDEYVAYRFPMIHWACALGQPYVVEWLVKQGFSSAVQHGESGDTGLHRVFFCMQTSSTKEPEKIINSMLPYLSDCFTVKNKLGNTPFHLSCELLHADTTSRNNKFFANCIKSIIETAKIVDSSCDLLLQILDFQNNAGNTGVHILAQHDRNIACLKICVSEGASLLLKNNMEMNALEMAINCGQTKNSKFLDAQWKIQKSCLDPRSLPKPRIFKHRTSSEYSEKPSTSSNFEDEIKILPRLRKKRKRLSMESNEGSQQYVVTTSCVEATSTSKIEEQDSPASGEGTVLSDSGIADVGKGFLSYLQHTGTETRAAIMKTINSDRNKILQEMNEYSNLTSGYDEKHLALRQQRDAKHEMMNRKLEEVMELQQDIGDIENKLILLENIHKTGPQKIAELKEKLKSCDLALNEMQVISGSSEVIVID
ncbi:uncharacterized protein LOC121380835 isoform X2 [Gigantopelta aegis]|nr:uncharacterized protein LOC121380835 isoform X2 [Gigantopelta aegis]